VETDINLWSQSYDRKLVDIFDIQSEIAKNVASELSMILSPTEIEQIDKRGTKNLEAYNFYLQGRHFFHRRTDGYEELKKSIEYFEKSLAIDTLYAVAYAGLADANFLLAWRDSNVSSLNGSERVTNTKEYVRKALEIDPNLGEAHAVLGMMTCYFDWEWVEGGKILEKAIEISPNYSTAHQYYSEYLDAIRQSDAARLEINKALDLNPLSITLLQISSSHYFNEQKLDEALREVLKAKELDSNQPVVYWKMFHIYKEQGKEEKAIQQLKHLWSMDSSLAKHIKLMDDIYAENGMNGVVKWWMSFEENKNPNNPHYIAMNYAVIGEDKLALDWLERAFDLGGLHLPGMNNNRMFKNIRSDPRFISMLDRMGLVRENK
jgi:tetratricopeptide (TPR) repeat protein